MNSIKPIYYCYVKEQFTVLRKDNSSVFTIFTISLDCAAQSNEIITAITQTQSLSKTNSKVVVEKISDCLDLVKITKDQRIIFVKIRQQFEGWQFTHDKLADFMPAVIYPSYSEIVIWTDKVSVPDLKIKREIVSLVPLLTYLLKR